MKSKLSINERREYFEKSIEVIKSIANHDLQLKKMSTLFDTLVMHGSGYFSCDILEKILFNISDSINVELCNDFVKNSTLHISTHVFNVGGHTRVIERWIETSPNYEKHSLLLTEHSLGNIPQRLSNAVIDKNGECISLHQVIDVKQKAIDIRKIASQYERVILHIHPCDISIMLAFGTNKFKRPVILYDHADFLFYLGVGIADTIAVLRDFGIDMCTYRKVQKMYKIGIPVDINSKEQKTNNKQKIREKLGFDKDKKIILTMASAYKYKPCENIDFLVIAEQIIKKYSDIVILAIGIDFNILPNWKDFQERYKSNFLVLPYIENHKLNDYIVISDLYLDSMPLGGGTAIIDVVLSNIPVLSLKLPLSQMDFIVNSKSYCKTQDELLEKIFLLLENEEIAAQYLKELQDNLNASGIVEWQKNIHNMYDMLANKEHNVYDFKSTTCNDDSINGLLCNLFPIDKELKVISRKKILFVEIIKMQNIYIKEKYINIFGCKMKLYTKKVI